MCLLVTYFLLCYLTVLRKPNFLLTTVYNIVEPSGSTDFVYFRGCHCTKCIKFSNHTMYILLYTNFPNIRALVDLSGYQNQKNSQSSIFSLQIVYVPLPTALEGPPNDGHGQPRAPCVANNSKNFNSNDFVDDVTRFMVVCD